MVQAMTFLIMEPFPLPILILLGAKYSSQLYEQFSSSQNFDVIKSSRVLTKDTKELMIYKGNPGVRKNTSKGKLMA